MRIELHFLDAPYLKYVISLCHSIKHRTAIFFLFNKNALADVAFLLLTPVSIAPCIPCKRLINILLHVFSFFRNPFDISRKSLLDQISRMRNNFLRSSLNSESLIDLGECTLLMAFQKFCIFGKYETLYNALSSLENGTIQFDF